MPSFTGVASNTTVCFYVCCIKISLAVGFCDSFMSFRLLAPPRQRLCHQVGLSVILSLCNIAVKVISRFNWNLVFWFDLPIRRTD